MSREIKFRGKCDLRGEWYVGDFITDIDEFNRTCDKAYIAPHWDKLNIPISVYPDTVGQYINQKDMTGNEIFIGDIVKREFEIFRETWEGSIEDNDLGPAGAEIIDEGYFVGVVSQTPQGLYVLNKCRKYDVEGNLLKKCSNVKLHAHRANVIGNIYDNPELLEASA